MLKEKKRYHWHVSIHDSQEIILFPINLYDFLNKLNHSMDTEIVNIVPLENKNKKAIAVIYKCEVTPEEHIEMIKEYEEYQKKKEEWKKRAHDSFELFEEFETKKGEK